MGVDYDDPHRRWLDPEPRDPDAVRALLPPIVPTGSAHPVDLEVGNVANSGPQLIRRLLPVVGRRCRKAPGLGLKGG